MKLIHLADLHIGKRVNEFPMLQEQEYILSKILDIIDQEKPDAVMIAGDIYDKPVPSTDAILCFDDFLTKLARRELMIFAIAGNHDSPERLSFGSGLFKKSHVYFAPVFQGEILPVRTTDDYGTVDIYMLPFVKPSQIRSKFPEEMIHDYNDAVRVVIEHTKTDPSSRNVILAHQFVTGALRSESEELAIGGLDNIDANLFDAFDYVALGHMHRAQSVKRKEIRYAGSPLKYSFSEATNKKSVTIVELKEKGQIEINEIPLFPKHDLKEIKGSYSALVEKAYYDSLNTEDYYHITLTDEEDVMDAMAKLRVIYKNLMKLDYDNTRTRTNQIIEKPNGIDEKTPLELFSAFYESQNNKPLNREQRILSENIIKSIWEDKE
ncbi:MAG: exonuclease SbcCD subunit D [Clostridia bacterium]|nr:exonuclease SbcCD subunit D [Clostridia bacterium]